MVVGVLGAGALGTLVGWSLAARHDVAVATREPGAALAIALRGGLVLEGEKPRRVRADASAAVFDGADVVIVAVKSYATAAALERFGAGLPRSTTIVSLQNGADAATAIEGSLGSPRAIALAPTTEAATALGDGVARRTANGTTILGWAEGRAGFGLDSVADAFSEAGLRTHVASPIEPYVWAKLVVNAAINPVTALARVRNGDLLLDRDLRARSAALAGEAAAVASAAGIRLPFDDPVAYVEGVARATAANRSSMLQDLERGRPTEIEAIAGSVVRRAAMFGVRVPETARVLDEVRARAKA